MNLWKITSIVLLGLLVSCEEANTLDGSNLVINGDFESSADGVNPDDWPSNYIPGSGLPGQFIIDSLIVYSGSYSLKALRYSQDGDGDAFIKQPISTANLVDGGKYVLSGFTKSNESEVLSIGLEAYVNGNQEFYANSNNAGNSDWLEISGTFTFSDNMLNLAIWLSMGGPMPSEDTGWFDNIQLVGQ